MSELIKVYIVWAALINNIHCLKGEQVKVDSIVYTVAHTSSIGTGAYISIAKAMKTWFELSISFTELHLVNNRLHDKLAAKTLVGSVKDNRMTYGS